MGDKKTAIAILADIQANLHAPKNQFNNFGKYKYRNCEDILEAVKPLAAAHGCAVIIYDEPVSIEGRHYIKAFAMLSCGTDADMQITASACAMEAESKKGMDSAQVTGATSSYARKYALNGLFAIDDTKDADSGDNSKAAAQKPSPKITAEQVANLEALIEEVDADKAAFLGWLKVDDLSAVTAKFYANAVNALEKKRNQS